MATIRINKRYVGKFWGGLEWAENAMEFLPFKIMKNTSRYPIFRSEAQFQERIRFG
jgi:hypothetical protein